MDSWSEGVGSAPPINTATSWFRLGHYKNQVGYLSQGPRIIHSCLIRSSSSMAFLEAFLPRGLAPLQSCKQSTIFNIWGMTPTFIVWICLNSFFCRGLPNLKMAKQHHMHWGKPQDMKVRGDLGLGNHPLHVPRHLNFGGSWCVDMLRIVRLITVTNEMLMCWYVDSFDSMIALSSLYIITTPVYARHLFKQAGLTALVHFN